jgi:diguanylate cyclase (GGDEF)-like protein
MRPMGAIWPIRSFKFKLLLYFAIVALVPVSGSYFGFETLAKRHETQKIDSRLRADLRSAIAGYSQQLDTAERRADVLPLVVVLPRIRAGIDPRDLLVAVQDGRIVAGPNTGAEIALAPGAPDRTVLGGTRYRGLLTSTLAAAGNVQFAALAPDRELAAAYTSARWRIAASLFAAVLLFGGLVYLLGISIVGTLRRLAGAADEIARGRFRERVQVSGRDEFAQVAGAFNRMAEQLEQRLIELEGERRRAHELTLGFGKALTATHDVERLLHVIVETIVEATGANGGFVQGHKSELARVGDPTLDGQRLELPLTVGGEFFGRIILNGPGFDDELEETASALAAQAQVALENARLHRLVEAQALIDPLTGLANRRSLEESLGEEVARAHRLGGNVCLVLADLDRFKAINDKFGHPTGDRALHAFAQTLREAVREIDSAGRWGGEEFALILPGTDAAGGVVAAERVQDSLASRKIEAVNGEPVYMTASFGVAALNDAGTLEALVTAADEALYQAKRLGRDRVATAARIPTP